MMKQIDFEWRGVKYPVIQVVLFEGIPCAEMLISVSSTELEDKLLSAIEAGSEEAQEIDNMFGYYLSEEEMKLNKRELVKLLEANIY